MDGGTVVGGTRQPHDWDPIPHQETRQTLLKNAAKWFPLVPSDDPTSERSNTGKTSPSPVTEKDFNVIYDIIGRRPFREGGARVEVERASFAGDNSGQPAHKHFGNIPVVHAYGLGARGFELSWGVAEDAAHLVVQEYLQQ